MISAISRRFCLSQRLCKLHTSSCSLIGKIATKSGNANAEKNKKTDLQQHLLLQAEKQARRDRYPFLPSIICSKTRTSGMEQRKRSPKTTHTNTPNHNPGSKHTIQPKHVVFSDVGCQQHAPTSNTPTHPVHNNYPQNQHPLLLHESPHFSLFFLFRSGFLETCLQNNNFDTSGSIMHGYNIRQAPCCDRAKEPGSRRPAPYHVWANNADNTVHRTASTTVAVVQKNNLRPVSARTFRVKPSRKTKRFPTAVRYTYRRKKCGKYTADSFGGRDTQ